MKRYTILKFALKILHEILHQLFFLKLQDAPLKEKIIAQLKKNLTKKKGLQAFTPRLFPKLKSQNAPLKEKIIARLKKKVLQAFTQPEIFLK